MSRYWRIDAPLGHDYEISEHAHQVAVVLHYAFITSNIIHSTILSNNIRCVEVYEHEVNCRRHGKDVNVFLLIESTDSICEANIVSYLASQFIGQQMLPSIKNGIGKLRFSNISRVEFGSVQAAFRSDMFSHNGEMVAHAA